MMQSGNKLSGAGRRLVVSCRQAGQAGAHRDVDGACYVASIAVEVVLSDVHNKHFVTVRPALTYMWVGDAALAEEGQTGAPRRDTKHSMRPCWGSPFCPLPQL